MSDAERIRLQPVGVAVPAGPYSQGVITSGRLLHVAGQTSIDAEGRLVGEGDIALQARQVLTNIQRIVEAAGAQMADVARVTVYITKLEYKEEVAAARAQFFSESPPVGTLVVVTSLADPRYLVEIDATAVLN